MLTNYQKGRSKEYRLIEKLRKEGFDIVFRSAGSHSPIDIVAINRETKSIEFVQSKPKKFGKLASLRLLNELSWLNDEFICTFKVV